MTIAEPIPAALWRYQCAKKKFLYWCYSASAVDTRNGTRLNI
jgi:hypothetical protein